MNLDLKTFTKKLSSLTDILQKYSIFIFVMAVLLVYAFVVYRVNVLSGLEPTDDMITEQIFTVKRPKIDEDSISKLQALEDRNVQVQTLFNDARNNPFQE